MLLLCVIIGPDPLPAVRWHPPVRFVVYGQRARLALIGQNDHFEAFGAVGTHEQPPTHEIRPSAAARTLAGRPGAVQGGSRARLRVAGASRATAGRSQNSDFT